MVVLLRTTPAYTEHTARQLRCGAYVFAIRLSNHAHLGRYLGIWGLDDRHLRSSGPRSGVELHLSSAHNVRTRQNPWDNGFAANTEGIARP